MGGDHIQPEVLGRRFLRYAAVLVIHDTDGSITPSEVHAVLVEEGYAIAGRPGKAVSDVLRTEVRRGRIARVGRGRYATGRLARSTIWYFRQRLEEHVERFGLRRRAESTVGRRLDAGLLAQVERQVAAQAGSGSSAVAPTAPLTGL